MDGRSRKELVEAYFDGFRRSDHDAILDLLTDDVVWDLYGHRRLEGKEAFDGEIENEAFTGPPKLTVDHLVEEGPTVVSLGNGEGTTADGEVFRFAFCTVLSFEGEKISRVQSYVVPV